MEAADVGDEVPAPSTPVPAARGGVPAPVGCSASSTGGRGWGVPSLVMVVLSVSMAGADEVSGGLPSSVPSCATPPSPAATDPTRFEVAYPDCVWFPSTAYHPATHGSAQPNHLA